VGAPDVHGRIPDFIGSPQAAEQLASVPAWKAAQVVEAVPDKAQQDAGELAEARADIRNLSDRTDRLGAAVERLSDCVVESRVATPPRTQSRAPRSRH
jgi:hypothetical protein